MFYIAYFKFLGCDLTNGTKGGDEPPSTKGRKHSEESKLKMSKSKKGKPILHLNNGKERSLLHKKNLSLSLKGRKSPNKGKVYTIEHKKILSEAHSHQKKRIVQMSLDGTIIKIWDSVSEAKKEYKNNHISECCTGKIKTAAGFIWKHHI
jgi:group I intron endonuclease